MSPRTQAFSHFFAFLLLGCLFASLRSSPSPVPRLAGKAQYNRGDARIYTPEVFERMFAARRSAGAVAARGRTKPFASGVLIARDLLLTARHVTYLDPRRKLRYAPADLEVRFDYVQRLDGSRPPPETWAVESFEEKEDGLDWILLRLRRNAKGQLPAADRVQRLSSTRAALDEPVFVVGFPRGEPLHIADGGQVLFPQEATMDELATILEREDPIDAPLIRGSYLPTRAGTVRNQSSTFDGHLTLGIDSDTPEGMSGSGVYLKRTGELIGILYNGQPAAPTAWRASWTRHEAVLALGSILAARVPPK